jgi:hypothetical protein
MHAHKLNYDSTTKQITFAHMLTNALYADKEVTIHALSSMVIPTIYKGPICDSAQRPTASYNFRDACLGFYGQIQ